MAKHHTRHGVVIGRLVMVGYLRLLTDNSLRGYHDYTASEAATRSSRMDLSTGVKMRSNGKMVVPLVVFSHDEITRAKHDIRRELHKINDKGMEYFILRFY